MELLYPKIHMIITRISQEETMMLDTSGTKRKIIKKSAYLLFLLVPILLYLPYLIGGSEVPGTTDLVQYAVDTKYTVQCLQSGRLPQWNHYLSNGIPQAGILNFYIVADLFFLLPVKEAVLMFFVFHLFIGGLFFFMYLRECRCSALVSFVFAIIFQCSIQINGMRRMHPGIIAAICLFPVIMFLVRRFFNTRRTGWLCLSAAVCAVQASSMQQYSIYAGLVLAIYILLFCIHEKYKVIEIIKKGILWVAVYAGIFAYVLLPVTSVLREYSEHGSSSISFGTFRSFSVHPVKLIQMILPDFFGERYMPLGIFNSSEMDIELYLGIFVFILAAAAAIRGRKRFEVRAGLVCAVFAFLYAAIAHIPGLNQLVYRLPLLGGFRCAGRMLYIFYFFAFSLAAFGLEDSFRNTRFEGQTQWMKKTAGVFVKGIALCFAAGLFYTCFAVGAEQRVQYFSDLQQKFFRPLCFAGIIFAVLLLLRKEKIAGRVFSLQWKRYAACAAVLAVTLAEVLPYSLDSETTDLAEVWEGDETVEQLMKDDGNYKIWTALDYVQPAYVNAVSQNKNLLYGFDAINAYTAFNNPLMFRYFKNLEGDGAEMNSSGLASGSVNALTNIVFQNDLLSMMGVRYVLDESGVIERVHGRTYNRKKKAVKVVSGENLKIDVGTAGGVGEVAGGLQGNVCYKISFKVNEEDNRHLTYLAVDLYGGVNYDLESQHIGIAATREDNEYEAYVFSDYAELANEEIRMRILVQADEGVEAVRVEDCDVTMYELAETYRCVGEDEKGTKIYENPNAKELLYVPERTKKMKRFTDIYDDYESYRLDTTAYVNRKGSRLGEAQTDVHVLSYENDSVTAEVRADGDTYVCFSQNYSPHWSAEVDGVEQKVDMVNGLIMGIEIPEGQHTVVFTYRDPSYAAGALVTGVTVVVLAGGILVGRRRRKKGGLDHD